MEKNRKRIIEKIAVAVRKNKAQAKAQAEKAKAQAEKEGSKLKKGHVKLTTVEGPHDVCPISNKKLAAHASERVALKMPGKIVFVFGNELAQKLHNCGLPIPRLEKGIEFDIEAYFTSVFKKAAQEPMWQAEKKLSGIISLSSILGLKTSYVKEVLRKI